MNVVPFPVQKPELSDIAGKMLQQAHLLARMKDMEGFFIVAFDKEAGHCAAFQLGDGVIGPTLLPAWLADVARRYSTMPAAMEDVEDGS